MLDKKQFRTAALIEDNGKATNSPNYRYRLTEETVQILRTMGTPKWRESIKRFLCYHEKLIDLYASKKKMTMMPDVVLYREDKDWIYFVESVTSVGPMDPKRILEIEEMTKERENLLSEGIDPQEKAIAFKVLNQMTQNANQIYEEEKKKNDK